MKIFNFASQHTTYFFFEVIRCGESERILKAAAVCAARRFLCSTCRKRDDPIPASSSNMIRFFRKNKELRAWRESWSKFFPRQDFHFIVVDRISRWTMMMRKKQVRGRDCESVDREFNYFIKPMVTFSVLTMLIFERLGGISVIEKCKIPLMDEFQTFFCNLWFRKARICNGNFKRILQWLFSPKTLNSPHYCGF